MVVMDHMDRLPPAYQDMLLAYQEMDKALDKLASVMILLDHQVMVLDQLDQVMVLDQLDHQVLQAVVYLVC